MRKGLSTTVEISISSRVPEISISPSLELGVDQVTEVDGLGDKDPDKVGVDGS